VAFEHAAGGHAGDRTHQLNRIADRMRDRVGIGVADITSAGVVPQRGLAGWMEAERRAEPLDLGAQRLAGLVVQVLPIDGVRGANDGDRAQFGDAAPRLGDGARNGVHRHLAGKFEPYRQFLEAPRGTEGLQTLCWREGDSNSQFRARMPSASPRHPE
jgi:hypothetical protein